MASVEEELSSLLAQIRALQATSSASSSLATTEKVDSESGRGGEGDETGGDGEEEGSEGGEYDYMAADALGANEGKAEGKAEGEAPVGLFSKGASPWGLSADAISASGWRPWAPSAPSGNDLPEPLDFSATDLAADGPAPLEPKKKLSHAPPPALDDQGGGGGGADSDDGDYGNFNRDNF